MNKNKINPILARLQGICFNDNGGDGGSGGGGAASTPAPAPAASTPTAGEVPANGGGQVQQDANYNWGARPTDTDGRAGRVRETLTKAHQDRNYTLNTNEIADLMMFDADFGASKPATGEQQQQQQQTPPQQIQQTPPANQQQPQQPQLSPDVAALVQALKQNIQQPAPQNPAPQAPQAPIPYYGGQVGAPEVSEQILTGILGTNDPQVLAQAKPAVNALVASIMNKVFEDSQARTVALLTAYARQAPQQVRQLQDIDQNERTFYSAFPELNKPAFKDAVDRVAGVVMTHMRKQDPNFRLDQRTIELIGTKAHDLIEKQLGVRIPHKGKIQALINPQQRPPQQQTQQRPAPQQTQQAPGQFMSPGAGARPPAAAVRDQSADVLNFVI